MTLTITHINKKGNFIGAKLNMVDLAGSERVKDSNVEGEALKEAAAINQSLYALAGVVDALSQSKKVIPYRNSKLTQLLSDSLGGNCQTTLLAMLSPSQIFCKESVNTLKFAHGCKKIQNVIKKNKYKGSIPAGLPFSHKVQSTLDKLKQKKMPWDAIKMGEPEVVELTVFTHKVLVHVYGDDDGHPFFLVPCNNMHHVIPSLIYAGYKVFFVMFPNVCENVGTALPSRSERMLEKNGLGDMMMNIIGQLGHKTGKVAIGGYDFGASLSLRVAANWPNRFSQVVCFHPSMGNTKPVKDELAKIRAAVLVLWIPADSFHPWNSWKNMPKSIANSTVETVKIHPWNSESAKGAYRMFSNQVCIPIVKFLTGRDPSGQAQAVFKAKEVAMVSTTGKNIKGRQLITFAEDITEDDLAAMTEKTDEAQVAVDALKKEDP